MTPPFGYLSLNRFTRVYGLLLIPYPADTQNRPIPILDGAVFPAVIMIKAGVDTSATTPPTTPFTAI